MLEGYIQALIDVHERNIVPGGPTHIRKDIESRVNELKSILVFYNEKCKKNINKSFDIGGIYTSKSLVELTKRKEIAILEVID